MYEKITRKVRKLSNILKEDGMKYFISKLISFFIGKFGLFNHTQIIKKEMKKKAHDIFNQKVAYGPFRGMYISEEIWWGENDVISKYLGEYEGHILQEIVLQSTKYRHFIDIGAADGYYAVGALRNNLFESATCFEISKEGQSVIAKNSRLNNVQNRIDIKGEANFEDIDKIINKFGPCLVLCDIEGNEYNLFKGKLYSLLKDSTIILELHDYEYDLKEKAKKLIQDSKNYFDINFIKRNSPAVNDFDELEDWDDDYRFLAFSEERPKRMHWIMLNPKN